MARMREDALTDIAARPGAADRTLEDPMQVDRSQLYRVRAVAELVDVSLSTVYRAIEYGHLDVLRIGKALRVPGPALAQWLNSCGYAAAAPGRDRDEVR